MNIREFAHNYYHQHVILNTSTGKSRFGIYKNHIDPYFGTSDFHGLSKIKIYDWRNSLIIRGYKPAMINKIQVIFGALIDLASDLEVAPESLRQQLGFKSLRTRQYREKFLSKPDFLTLTNSCLESNNPFLLDIVLLLTLTGARKREILDSKWVFIDLGNGILNVPVSKNGDIRRVYLNDQSIRIFEAVKIKNRDLNSEFVFPNMNTGKPYQCIYHSWNLARQNAGLNEVRIHDLRHSFASALVNEGVPIYDVQHLLGHKSVKTTQRYAHLQANRLRISSFASGKFYFS